MLAVQQRITGRDQEHRGEQIPLRFQPGIGTDIEKLARNRVDGADENGHKYQPGYRFSDEFIRRVDSARQRQ